MPGNRKRKQNAKSNKNGANKKPSVASAQAASASMEQVEESKVVTRASFAFEDAEDARVLSTEEIKAMVEATAEYADSNAFSSYGDLSRHMQTTIS